MTSATMATRANNPTTTTSSSGKTKHSESLAARFLGSGTSGLLELILFHPVDTVAKRLMSNTQPIFVNGEGWGSNAKRLNQVIFQKAATAESLSKRYMSLFPGFGFAAGYKISQRIYKFGGQPYVLDLMRQYPTLTDSMWGGFSKKNQKWLTHATAGSIIGIGEIFLLPLDVLKIKKQTNPNALAGRQIWRLFWTEGRELYRGAGWTALRNAPGSFALFGGSAIVKEHVFKLEDYNRATLSQNFVASIAGAVASITVAAPLDVVKTRIQNRNFGDGKRGMKVIGDLLKQEGVRGFFKGLTPKVLVVGPKLIFSFTVAQHSIPLFAKLV